MTLTPEQQLIVLMVNETPDARISANVAAIWAQYANEATLDYNLQIQYTKRDCLDLALGYWQDLAIDINAFEDAQIKASQKADHLRAMKAECIIEINRLEKKARQRRVGFTMPLVTTAPISPPLAPAFTPTPVPGQPNPTPIAPNWPPYPYPPYPYPDANDPGLAGSPYYEQPNPQDFP